ncbi:MAG: hypothetical protein AAFX87_02450 [Bacteroidota bacterium]
MKDIVHKYYKREFDDFKVLVQINPDTYAGIELTVPNDGNIEKRKLTFDEEIFDDLAVDDFEPSSPLEFNLYLKGIR